MRDADVRDAHVRDADVRDAHGRDAGVRGAGAAGRFTFAAVSGFLGAGKTTTLVAVARAMEARGLRTALITNDQGEDLVDTAVASVAAVAPVATASPAPAAEAPAGVPAGAAVSHVAEVTGGCFCCRFEDLSTVVRRAVEEHGAEVVLAEAVGSCTDLQATVVRPLQQAYGARVHVAPLVTVAEPARFTSLAATADPDLAYLFDRQLAEADLIALNKSDVTSGERMEAVRAALRGLHPKIPVHLYSALTGAGLGTLTDVLAGGGCAALPGRGEDLELDYDRYAAAEARLAWLNHTVTATGTGAGVGTGAEVGAGTGAGVGAPVGAGAVGAGEFAPAVWARTLLAELAAHGWYVGHAKVHLAGDDGRATRAHLTCGAPEVAEDGGPVRRAAVRINARMACAPGELDAAVRAAVRAADAATGATSSATAAPASFRPAYPRPVHRIPAGA